MPSSDVLTLSDRVVDLASVSPAEVTVLIDTLIDEIQTIEGQLAERKRRRASGTPLTTEEYRAWRQSALTAKRLREGQLRQLKRWLRQHQQEVAWKAFHLDPHDPSSLLAAAYHVLRELDRAVGLPSEQQALQETVRQYLYG